jgi:predicted tellurium resistance membrane protein TerC
MLARRRVLGGMVGLARIIGFGLIVLAVLSLPPMRFLAGSLAGVVAILSSLALGVVGIVLLIGVQVFLRFFDQFLSRN